MLTLKTEAASYTEAVSNALRLCEALIRETENARQFFVRDETGAMTPCRLFP
nr:hypothetical protein [uncultured Rhodopila sp.]